MSVRSTALRFAKACRAAMPDARVSVEHSRNRLGGLSSYVHIQLSFGHDHRLFRKARVSDHGIGQRRYDNEAGVLYLAEGARSDAWELWLSDVAAEYERRGGNVPALGGLFAA